MNQKHTCANCGAPLEAKDEHCTYCGSITPYGESMLSQHNEHEQLRTDENVPKVKYISVFFMPVLYFFTAFGYAPYWYATRMKSLNALTTETRLPKFMVYAYVLAWTVIFIVPGNEIQLEITKETSRNIFTVSFFAIMILSVWLAFTTRTILQSYASKYMERREIINTIASSGMMLIILGPLYLQWHINRMFKKEMLIPKI